MEGCVGMVLNALTKVIATATVLVTLSGFTSGCSTQSAENDPRLLLREYAIQLREIGAEENAKLIENGELSEKGYLEAATRYQTCMRLAGVELDGPFFSPVDGRSLEWGTPEENTGSPGSLNEQDVCLAAWSPIVRSFIQTHAAVMDEPLRLAVVSCLQEKGFEAPKGSANFEELSGGSEQIGSPKFAAAEQCTVTNASALYPDLPAISVAL